MTRFIPLKTRQSNPISAYHFILDLEIVFVFITESKNVEDLTNFNDQFLYTTYVDAVIFLSNKNSVTEATNIFEHF